MAHPGRHKGTVRWTSTQDADDAGEVSAEIEAWLARQPAAADWAGVLGALRDGLLLAGLEAGLVGDTAAREIIAGLAEAEDLAAIDASLARLSARADALVALRERVDRGHARPLAELMAEARGPGDLRDRIRL